MNSKGKLVLSKLLKVAEQQQNALKKLAQAAQPDPAIVQYLKSTWQTAALNSGAPGSSPEVSFNASASLGEGVTAGETYVVKGEMPEAKRELFTKNFSNQIKSQKPDLDGKVSTVFLSPNPAKSASSGVTMDSKNVLQKLLKIAENQQKIITKLAQAAGLEPAPMHLAPQNTTKREAATILAALPPATRAAVAILEVHGDQVPVKFHPGKGSDAAFQSVVNTVQQLSSENKLPLPNYKVVEKV